MKTHLLYADCDLQELSPVDINVSAKAEKLLTKVHLHHAKYLEAQRELLLELDKHNSGREWAVGDEIYSYDFNVSEWNSFDTWIGSNNDCTY